MPSSTAIVLNSRAMPPAAWIAAETMRPTGARCVCPGTNSVKLFATAMIGLPMSSAATPVARSSARAPAMLRPWVTVRDRSSGISVSFSSDDPARPAVPVAGPSVLDVHQLLAHVHRDLARIAVGDREVELGARKPADGCDDRRRAAREHLTDRTALQTGQHLGERDVTLVDLVAGIPQQLDDGRTGHAFEDRPGQPGGGYGTVGVDQEDVHAAELFKVRVGPGVQEADLLAALGVCLLLRQQARGVVAAALGGSGAARSRPVVVLRDPDRDRLDATREVPADRRGDHQVLDLVRRAHAEEALGGVHEGAQVQGQLVAALGNPGQVGPDQGRDRAEEVRLAERRERESLGRRRESLGIRLGPEQPDRSVVVPVGLEPLEDLLPVMQHRGSRVQLRGRVRFDPPIVPAAREGPRDARHVVGEDRAELRCGDQLGTLLGGAGCAGESDLEGRGGIADRGREAFREGGAHGRWPFTWSLSDGTGGGGRCGKVSVGRGGFRWPQWVMRAARSSPISAVERTWPPRSARSAATAASTARACSVSPRWSSSMLTESTVAVGSALPWPAMSGAEPCTGSNIDGAVRSGLTLPDAARPMPPVIAAAWSVRMSTKRLSVTTTSNRDGFVVMKIVAASTCR